MAEARYPVFAAGQTLTKDDLNLLRTFADGQDRLVARLMGFGIACGLSGRVTDGELRISPGLALDQAGNGLLLDAQFSVSAGTTAAMEAFDFIEVGPGGVTPVLVLGDTLEEAPECDEAGCEAHAATGVRRAEIVLTAGRLITAAGDFSTEPLLSEVPLTITRDGTVQGNFDRLRGVVLDRLADVGVTLPADVLARLSGLTLPATLLPAIRMYRAAFLNHVFFAALDLLRCRSLHTGACLHTAARPGVALGWLHVEAGVPVWDCRHRHDFEPPQGLVTALLGGGCDDPCELFENRLHALVRGYAEPVVPAPADPPKPPPDPEDFHICVKTSKQVAYRNLYRGIPTDCFDYVHPPELLPDWPDLYLEEQPPFRRPGLLPDPPPFDLVYAMDSVDFADAGVISLLPAFGAVAGDTRSVLQQVITGQQLTPDVRLMTQAEAAGLPGFAPQSSVSLGDTIVLVHDTQNKIVATGRITNQKVLKSAGAQVAGARDAADSALGAAQDAHAVAKGADTKVNQFGTQVTAISTQMTSLTGQVSGVQAELGGLRGTINVFGTSVAQVNSRVDGLAQRADDLSGLIQSRVDGFGERITAAEGLARQLQENLGGVLKTVAGFDLRIDEVYRSQFLGRDRGLVPRGQEVNSGLVDFFGVMRRAVEVAAATRRRPAVREELARGEAAMELLTVRAGREEPLVVSDRTAIATLVRSLVAAAERAGLSDDVMTEVRNTAETLLDRLGTPPAEG
ncbi:hypothetical protein [Nonomuraea bangladeshensis]|uniref:hypothetical protein n=1 Tax=Nonomuraea bangladeshensis TaxID=404385 RepID=UPI003C2B7C85